MGEVLLPFVSDEPICFNPSLNEITLKTVFTWLNLFIYMRSEIGSLPYTKGGSKSRFI